MYTQLHRGHMDTSVVVEAPGRRIHGRHSAQFKPQVIRACRQPGVSIASVALANGLNANMLRRWVVDAECAGTLAVSGHGALAVIPAAVAGRADAHPCGVGTAR